MGYPDVGFTGRVLQRCMRWLGIYPPDARNDWIAAKLREIPPGGMILDAGCGWQVYRPLCAHLEYRAQDFGKYDGVGDGRNVQTQEFFYGNLDYVGDIWKIDERDAVFDAVMCTEVIEHVPYPNETVAELARLLKPGGVLLMTAPFNSTPHMTPYYYYTGFAAEWYRAAATRNGLVIEEITPAGNYFDRLLFDSIRAYRYVPTAVGRALFLGIWGLTGVPLLRLCSMLDRGSSEDNNFGLMVKFRKPA